MAESLAQQAKLAELMQVPVGSEELSLEEVEALVLVPTVFEAQGRAPAPRVVGRLQVAAEPLSELGHSPDRTTQREMGS